VQITPSILHRLKLSTPRPLPPFPYGRLTEAACILQTPGQGLEVPASPPSPNGLHRRLLALDVCYYTPGLDLCTCTRGLPDADTTTPTGGMTRLVKFGGTLYAAHSTAQHSTAQHNQVGAEQDPGSRSQEVRIRNLLARSAETNKLAGRSRGTNCRI
jgi:hypothetical protein